MNRPEMHGILLLDKPCGITSQQAIARVKRALSLRKVGHAGTLDPLASGLLVVLLGSATRLQELAMAGRKCYEGAIQLGVETDTDDLSGTVIARSEPLPGGEEELQRRLREIRPRFVGRILQRPPVYSAVKVDGKRAYALARAGSALELEPREIEIDELGLEAVSAESIRYVVRCSKGTYVRSLARDIGRALGSVATLASIRRIASGNFCVSEALSLDTVERTPEVALAALRSVRELVRELPSLVFPRSGCEELRHGRQEALRRYSALRLPPGELGAITDEEGEIWGLATSEGESWRIRLML